MCSEFNSRCQSIGSTCVEGTRERYYSSILPLVDSSLRKSVFVSECKILCRPNLFFNLLFKEVLHLPMIWNS